LTRKIEIGEITWLLARGEVDGGRSMDSDLLIKVLGFWVLLALVAILNGIFRGAVLEPWLGKSQGHILSTFLLITMFLVAIHQFLHGVDDAYSRSDLLVIGVIWTIMTISFEFAFGHYVMKHPWERLLADYNLLKGRLWSLVLIAILFGPLLLG